MEEKRQTPTGTKKIAAIVIAAVLVIGGAVAAFALIGKSPKEKYFLAEKDSMDFIVDQFEKRYQPETDWAELTREKPSKASYEVSAKYDGPGLAGSQELAMLNNSSLKVETGTDYKKKVATADVTLNLSGLEFGGLKFGITKDELTAKLPFVKDTLLIKDKDLPNLLSELDSTTDVEGMEFDFAQFFEQGLPEENQEYIKKEYGNMIYDEIPDEAFESKDEKVKIGKSDISTEKITMKLSEKQTKDIIVKVLNKAKNDKKLKAMLQNQIGMQNFGMQINQNEYSKAYKENIEDMIQDVKDASIPNGVKSTIWVADKLVVKRDFSVKAGETKDDLTQVTVKGEQNLGDNKQTFDYVFKSKTDFKEDEMTAKADFSHKDDKIKDSAEFAVDGDKVNYEGNESLKDGKRKFERVVSFNESAGKPSSLVWSGTAKYKKEGMESDHTFKVDAPDMGNQNIELYMKKDAHTTDSIKKPSKENVKDLGKMSQSEIENYFMNEVIPSIGAQFGF
ncbi:hypothetical protein QR721_08815 [Aciduricibacillus chroicocephali]|uniref:DUF945 domain-containing protein n=1 Tax=Aciduricibacillus chroicocephali TaxID=3054939 RepID=A0ABY9KSP3_9BACI|nr:hypothetical protein QR721_08815 [Bacillaceae bacterium 44XB]